MGILFPLPKSVGNVLFLNNLFSAGISFPTDLEMGILFPLPKSVAVGNVLFHKNHNFGNHFPDMNHNRRMLNFSREKIACDQKLLLLTFYVKPYLAGTRIPPSSSSYLESNSFDFSVLESCHSWSLCKYMSLSPSSTVL